MRNSLRVLFLLGCIACIPSIHAQKVGFDDVLTIQLKNMGPIIKANEVSGYYMFYKVDKVDRNTNAYLLTILDANLNKVSEKKIVESKYFTLQEAAYDGASILLKFYDTKAKMATFYQYDDQAKEKMKKTFPLSKYEISMVSAQQDEEIKGFTLFELNGKGFLNFGQVKNKEIGYQVRFFPEDGGQGWMFPSDPASKSMENATYLAATDKVVYATVVKKFGVMSRDLHYHLLGLDFATGKKLFEKTLEDDKYQLQVLNGYTDESSGNVVMLGLYFDKDEKIAKSKSNGLFAVTVDGKGDIVSRKFISWAKDVSKVLPVDKKGKIEDVGYLFFHNIFRTADGRVFAVAENFRKAASALGIAATAMGGNASMAKIVVEDVYIFEFAPDFSLSAVKVFDKSKTSVELPSGAEVVSPQLLALYVKAYDGFDYNFTQLNRDKSVFSVGYVDWDRKVKNLVFGAVTHSGQEYSTDKIKMETEASSLRVMPGKPGYVLITEYFRKKKHLDMRLEKINY